LGLAASALEASRAGETVAAGAIRNATCPEAHRLAPAWGHPADPVACGEHLFWAEYHGGRGRLFHAPVEDVAHARATPREVSALASRNIGRFTVCSPISGERRSHSAASSRVHKRRTKKARASSLPE
jgi:hypothetical protein